jgi:hypothetical protein
MTDKPENAKQVSPCTEEELAKHRDFWVRYNRDVQEWIDILRTPEERAESDPGPSTVPQSWRQKPGLL